MDLLQTGIFNLAERRLAWADKRQELLSRNISNANTPGWKPSDLPAFAQTLSRATPLTLAGTQGSWQQGTLGGDPRAVTPKPRQVSPDGNAVVVEDELAKVADTQGIHTLANNLYAKYLGFFRTALGRVGQ